jgi:hypothetical protein
MASAAEEGADDDPAISAMTSLGIPASDRATSASTLVSKFV